MTICYYYVLEYLDWCGNMSYKEGVAELTGPIRTYENIDTLKKEILKEELKSSTKAKALTFKVLSKL